MQLGPVPAANALAIDLSLLLADRPLGCENIN